MLKLIKRRLLELAIIILIGIAWFSTYKIMCLEESQQESIMQSNIIREFPETIEFSVCGKWVEGEIVHEESYD